MPDPIHLSVVSSARKSTAIRVLHVIPRLGPGGSERALFTLMREMSHMGITSHLCVLGSENAFPERLQGLEPPLFLNYSNSYRDIAGLLRCAIEIRKLVRGLKPDIVHSHLWPAARMVGFALRGMGIRQVVHVQDTREWLASGSVRSHVMRALTRLALAGQSTEFVAVADAVERYTVQHLPWIGSSITVIHNGLEVQEFANFGSHNSVTVFRQRKTKDSCLVVGSAGRFMPEKGQEVLLRAIAELRAHGVRVTAQIAGDGSRRHNIMHLIEELRIGDAVELLGRVSDMASFYSGLDVFALPSISAEGLPLTLLEAMSARCAVVTSDVAGASEVIRNEVDGLVVPPGNSAALAHGIERLYRNPKLRWRISESGYSRVMQHFTGARMAAACADTYLRVVGE